LEAPLREVLYRVLASLYDRSERLAVIEYPRRIDRRSLDIAAALHEEKRVLIKVAVDAGRLPRGEVQELISLSSVLGVSPLIVARMKMGEELAEGVVYERMGASVVSPETLDMVVSGRGEVYVYESKDSFKVRVNPERLRRRRLELGLSLGDLASLLGTSRKTIYDYERGVADPTLEKAERLVGALGEDILEPVEVFRPPPRVRVRVEPRTRLEAIVSGMLESHGYTVARARRTAVDLGCSRDDKRMTLVLDESAPRRRAPEEKLVYFGKLSETVMVDYYTVVTDDERRARELSREGINAVTPRELSDVVAGAGDERVLPDGEAGGRKEHDSLEDS